MKYLWIVILIILGGLWSIASIYDIIDSIRYGNEPEPFALAWAFTIIVGLFFWSLALWFLG